MRTLAIVATRPRSFMLVTIAPVDQPAKPGGRHRTMGFALGSRVTGVVGGHHEVPALLDRVS